jgi:hypothetical protein
MIYGGQVANASARHRKQERREVCSVKVATPVYLDWSDKPIMKGKCALGPFLSILVIECQHKCLNVNPCP